MRVVSLNLDADDAAVVRCALATALTSCPCGDEERCPTCEALGAVMAELDGLLTRRARRRASLPADIGSLDSSVVTTPAAALHDRQGLPPARRLWVVRGGLAGG